MPFILPECGCQYDMDDGGIVFCPLHTAAPALLEAAKTWMKVESEMRDNNPYPDLGLRAQYRKEAVALTSAAIAKAEGNAS